MEVGILFKIGAVGILVSVLCQVLKHSGREEQAFLASLAGLVLVLFWILPYISTRCSLTRMTLIQRSSVSSSNWLPSSGTAPSSPKM